MRNIKRINSMLTLIKTKDSSFWKKKQRENSIEIFQSAAKNVPAYQRFLKSHNISPSNIKSWRNFKTLPTIDKANYLRINKLNDLCWDGKLTNHNIFTSTSGSTGNPFYFLRSNEIDWQCSVFLEDFIRAGNEKKMPSTLAIVCFGMGVWIGGLITFNALEFIGERSKFPISVITPGINKKEILTILKELLPFYSQVILAGYPPFIKDVIDEAEAQKISFKDKKVKIKFAAEAISEDLRSYIAKKTKMKNKFLDTINFYGSADIGAMAVENTTCILIKHLINGNEKLFNEIFCSVNRTPTLAQYNPYFVNFESHEGSIYLTGNNTLPLIRYAIGDKGGTMSFDELDLKFKKYGINLKLEAKKLGLENYITELPFVYVYERDDLSTSFYGLWIYPEWIRGALFDTQIQKYISGKFTLITKYDDKQNQFMELNLELRREVKLSKQIKNRILKKVLLNLQSHSSEYTEIVQNLKSKAYPVIQYWPYEDPVHFLPGIKQKWVKQSL